LVRSRSSITSLVLQTYIATTATQRSGHWKDKCVAASLQSSSDGTVKFEHDSLPHGSRPLQRTDIFVRALRGPPAFAPAFHRDVHFTVQSKRCLHAERRRQSLILYSIRFRSIPSLLAGYRAFPVILCGEESTGSIRACSKFFISMEYVTGYCWSESALYKRNDTCHRARDVSAPNEHRALERKSGQGG
jgi:hypothetical protein